MTPIKPATCTVQLPQTWRDAIAHGTVALAPGSRVIPFAVGSDPTAFFGAYYSSAWSGVVSVAVPTGQIEKIHAFVDPSSDQAYAGDFDGRWLVWVQSLSLTDSNDWQLWAWDTTTHQSMQIARAALLNGQPILGPIVEPVVSNGKAAWVQASEDGIGVVHLFDLASGHDELVADHDTTPVLFWGNNLVWQHPDIPGRSGHMEMMDTTKQQRVPVPPPLGLVRGLAFMAVSPTLIAWTDGPSIWAYREGDGVATLLYSLDRDHASFLSIAGDFITWDGSMGPSVLDMRSSSVARLTPAYGGRLAEGRSLLMYWPTGQQKSISALAISEVDASTLPPLALC